MREGVYRCTCSHGVSALQKNDRSCDRHSCVKGTEPVPGAGRCWGSWLCVPPWQPYSQTGLARERLSNAHSSDRYKAGGEGSAPTSASRSVQGRSRGQHTHLCFQESLQGYPGSGDTAFPAEPVSMMRGNALMSSTTSLSSGKGLRAGLGATQQS